MIIRWARKHATAYDQNLPQRFHLGDVPRIGGVALLAGVGKCGGIFRILQK